MVSVPAKPPRFDILGIGNAIVDVVAPVPDAFLSRHDMHKGAMALIDAETADRLYASMPPAQESSGGSVANTCAVAAGLGARVAYLGRVADDALGATFRHDIAAAGVHFPTPPLSGGAPTARCLVLVTPDGQRTMNTFLGACVAFGEDEVDETLVADAAVTYLEGYLFDPPRAKEAFRKAAGLAHAAGRRVSLSLSDPFCVGRYRAEFRELVQNHVDVLFANESEICSLYETEDFDAAVAQVRGHCEIAALTRSEKGSVVVAGTHAHLIDAARVEKVLDTTGAGDLYASGFLFGLTHGRDLATCGKLGSLCAAEAIGHFGARPETPLKTLAAKAGLL
jgi:sugar/nucleoside kinase (ribokinase family)